MVCVTNTHETLILYPYLRS